MKSSAVALLFIVIYVPCQLLEQNLVAINNINTGSGVLYRTTAINRFVCFDNAVCFAAYVSFAPYGTQRVQVVLSTL